MHALGCGLWYDHLIFLNFWINQTTSTQNKIKIKPLIYCSPHIYIICIYRAPCPFSYQFVSDLIDQRGVEPLLDLYDHLGGWPMVNSTWDPNSFDLMYTLSELRLLNNRYLVDIWVSADDRNSTVNIVQASSNIERSFLPLISTYIYHIHTFWVSLSPLIITHRYHILSETSLFSSEMFFEVFKSGSQCKWCASDIINKLQDAIASWKCHVLSFLKQ